MQNDSGDAIKDLAQIINAYISSKDSKYIDEIEEHIAKLFLSEYAVLTYYDAKTQMLGSSKSNEPLALESSIIQNAILQKSTIVSNHLTSDKHYNQSIDNPNQLKIRSMLVMPIVKSKQVIGVLCIQKALKDKRTFTKNDEVMLESIAPLLINFLQKEMLDKTITSNKKNAKDTLSKAVPTDSVKPTVSKNNDVEKKVWDEQIKMLKSQLDEALQKNIQLENSVESTLKEQGLLVEKLSQSETLMQSKEEAHKKLMGELTEKYNTVEQSSMEFISENKSHLSKIKEVEERYTVLKKDYEELKSELKEEKQKSIVDLSALKKGIAIDTQVQTNTFPSNLDLLLAEVDTKLTVREYAYTLFEILLYALESNKGMDLLEEMMQKTKVVSEVIKRYYFKGDIKVNNEKHLISNMVKKIKEYEKTAFINSFKLMVEANENVPVSLVFDAPKVQSIVFHLLTDMHNFVDYDAPVKVDIGFKEKHLIVAMKGSIHPQNSFFKSIFKQSAFNADEKQRMGISFSRKLIERLKGTITTEYDDASCFYTVNLPVELIKY